MTMFQNYILPFVMDSIVENAQDNLLRINQTTNDMVEKQELSQVQQRDMQELLENMKTEHVLYLQAHMQNSVINLSR